MSAATPLAAIFGCSGVRLTAEEAAFFREARPLGFILFLRNCEAPDQVRGLVAELRASVGRDDAPVLIDQEGGRVARLRPPRWRRAPAAAKLAERFAAEPERTAEAVRLNARLIAADLAALGITVDCAPVVDLRLPETHQVIGDRAFGADPATVGRLARAMADGLLDGGVLPVIKHIPGHGRATVDSHFECPRVTADRASLEASDFAAFRALADLPLAMTAHVVYASIDERRPASLSPTVIGEVVRGSIGFAGVLLSDDLSMAALQGSLAERTRAALAAGCDVALHCNGELAEMREVAAAARPLEAAVLDRVAAAEALRTARARTAGAVDLAAADRQIEAFIAARGLA